MLRDREMYPNPEVFQPERFENLTQEESKRIDPRNIAFGFGRRLCVGALFADNALYMALVTILACFDIRKQVIDGREIDPLVDYPKFIGQPAPFFCKINVRSEAAHALIQSATDGVSG